MFVLKTILDKKKMLLYKLLKFSKQNGSKFKYDKKCKII